MSKLEETAAPVRTRALVLISDVCLLPAFKKCICETLSQFELIGIWSKQVEVAKAFHNMYMKVSLPIYTEKSKGKFDVLKKTLKSSEIDVVILAMEPETPGSHSNYSVAATRCVLENTNLSIFSLLLPSLDMNINSNLYSFFEKNSDNKWSLCTPMRFESGFNKLLAASRDIGDITAGELRGNTLPNMLPAWSSKPSTRLFQICCQYSAALTKIFGAADYVISSPSTPEGLDQISGIFVSKKGVPVTFCACLEKEFDVPECELKIWGTLGSAELLYNHLKGVFEVRRQLNNFEHPSLHQPTGFSWSVASFLNNLSKPTADPGEIFIGFVDCAISNAFIRSNGRPVGFKTTPTVE